MVLSSCGLRRQSLEGGPMHINVSRLIFDVENESSTVQKEKIERKEKRGRRLGAGCWPSPGRVRTGCPGSRDLHAVPARVRGRADQEPVSDDDGCASVPTNWPCSCSTSPTSRREGDRVERRQAAGCRDRQLNGRRRQSGRCRLINSVQFVPSPDVPILTPITRGP